MTAPALIVRDRRRSRRPCRSMSARGFLGVGGRDPGREFVRGAAPTGDNHHPSGVGAQMAGAPGDAWWRRRRDPILSRSIRPRWAGYGTVVSIKGLAGVAVPEWHRCPSDRPDDRPRGATDLPQPGRLVGRVLPEEPTHQAGRGAVRLGQERRPHASRLTRSGTIARTDPGARSPAWRAEPGPASSAGGIGVELPVRQRGILLDEPDRSAGELRLSF